LTATSVTKMLSTLRAHIGRSNAAIWCRAVDLCGDVGNLRCDSFSTNGAKGRSGIRPLALRDLGVGCGEKMRLAMERRNSKRYQKAINKNLSQHDRAA